MNDGYIDLTYDDVVKLSTRYKRTIRTWAFNEYMVDFSHENSLSVEYNYKTYGRFIQALLWTILLPITFMVVMLTGYEWIHNLLITGIKRPQRITVEYNVRVNMKRRIKEDNLKAFASASREYGNIQMSIENYASILEIIDYKCPLKTLREQLSSIEDREV
jgi:hypothetical protein